LSKCECDCVCDLTAAVYLCLPWQSSDLAVLPPETLTAWHPHFNVPHFEFLVPKITSWDASLDFGIFDTFVGVLKCRPNRREPSYDGWLGGTTGSASGQQSEGCRFEAY